jgi:hypothetical protein
MAMAAIAMMPKITMNIGKCRMGALLHKRPLGHEKRRLFRKQLRAPHFSEGPTPRPDYHELPLPSTQRRDRRHHRRSYRGVA